MCIFSSGAMAQPVVAEVVVGLVVVAVAAADQEWIGGTDRINKRTQDYGFVLKFRWNQ